MSTTSAPSAATDLPVAVIGAGPVGLAAAAHLRARGLPVVVLEAGARAGAAVRQWGHVRTFTPWRWLVDPEAERLLASTGWSAPSPATAPTGAELVAHYLEPLAAALGDAVRTGTRVTAVTRDGLDKTRTAGRADRPFLLRLQTSRGPEELRARAVVDASGTWGSPNPLGASGLPADGEREARAAGLVTGPLPDVLGADRARFAGRSVLVVGAGHSAAGTLLALARLAQDEPATRITWAVRGADPRRVYGGGTADQLEARGRLGSDVAALVASGTVELVTGFRTASVAAVADGAAVDVTGTTPDGARTLRADVVVAATGFRPDLSLLSELRLDLDPGLEAPRALAPLVDPEHHSCGTVPPHGAAELQQPEPGLYVVGMKSYGRAPTFLVATGNEQVRSVAAALAGDATAAAEVRLVLPETGVCSTRTAPDPQHATLVAGVPLQGFATGVPSSGAVAASASGGGSCCA